jgi:large subunit ribosomal protein L14e
LTNVRRQIITLKRLSLTDFTVDIQHGARQGTVAAAWTKADVNSKWDQTAWAKKRAVKARRAAMNDFDRFKLMKARKRVRN